MTCPKWGFSCRTLLFLVSSLVLVILASGFLLSKTKVLASTGGKIAFVKTDENGHNPRWSVRVRQTTG